MEILYPCDLCGAMFADTRMVQDWAAYPWTVFNFCDLDCHAEWRRRLLIPKLHRKLMKIARNQGLPIDYAPPTC